MSNTDYLMKEYELCFEQLKYYDTRHTATLKYLVTLASAVATALFALYKYFGAPNPEYFILQALLAILVWVGSLLLHLSMVENRVYYVRIARQINMIRDFFLKSTAGEFRPRNQLWRSAEMPMFRFGSLHTHQLMGSVLTSSAFLGLLVYSILSAKGLENPFAAGILGTLVCFVLVFLGSAIYLSIESKKSVNKDSQTGKIEVWPPNETNAANAK